MLFYLQREAKQASVPHELSSYFIRFEPLWLDDVGRGEEELVFDDVNGFSLVTVGNVNCQCLQIECGN